MFQRKRRRFRRGSNGRGQHSRTNGFMQGGSRPNTFSHSQSRNNFRSTQSAEKLLEKYNALAKEALSSGDKTLSENYLQHVDHFTRIIEDKNKNKERTDNNFQKKEENNKPQEQINKPQEQLNPQEENNKSKE